MPACDIRTERHEPGKTPLGGIGGRAGFAVGSFVAVCCVAATLSAGVTAVSREHVVRASDVRSHAGGLVLIGADGSANDVPADRDVIMLRFDTLPCYSPPAAWLCLRDGRRLRGDAIRFNAQNVILQARNEPDAAVPQDDLAAFFYAARQPAGDAPDKGIRILSVTGDVLDAPAIELMETGIAVDMGPTADPIVLTPDRVSGVIWPEKKPAGPEPEPQGQFVELRDGRRLLGEVVAIDGESISLRVSEAVRKIGRREVHTIWWQRPNEIPIEQVLEPEAPSNERPKYRLGRNALGGHLRIGHRVYIRGLGVRGPTGVDITVPGGAVWFLADVGADGAAAEFARITCRVLVDGVEKVQTEPAAPGEPAQPIAVMVADAKVVTVVVSPQGDDSTGCLGDFADAVFIGR